MSTAEVDVKRQVSELLETTAKGVGMLTPAESVELLRALDSLVPFLPAAAGDAFRDAAQLVAAHLEERVLYATPIDAYRSELQRHADVAAGAMKTPPPLVVVLDTPVPAAMIVGAEDAPAPAAPRVDPPFAELGWGRNMIVITTGLLDALRIANRMTGGNTSGGVMVEDAREEGSAATVDRAG